jgi:hypothetical protein
MRRLLMVLIPFLALACTNPYEEARKLDTIDAYDSFLKENPNSSFVAAANTRLEQLFIDRANTSGSLEDWDAYMARFPQGQLLKEAEEGRMLAFYLTAENTDTVEIWQEYIKACDAYKKCSGSHKKAAPKRLKVAQNKANFEVGPLELKQVNLAEQVDGPLDGWGFYADVTNKGTAPIERMIMRVRYLNLDGKEIDRDDSPVVSKKLPGNMPMAPGFDKPIGPGEVRRWEWTTGDMPAEWSKQAKLEVVEIRLAGDDKKADEQGPGDKKGEGDEGGSEK